MGRPTLQRELSITSSSPIAERKATSTTLGTSQKDPISVDSSDSSDEDLGDFYEQPSRSKYFTQPTQIIGRHVTQPTQILPQRSVAPRSPVAVSPSSSTVEIPASSPFQGKTAPRPPLESYPKPKKNGFASLMAPAGTAFRAPTASRPAIPRKRPATEIDQDDFTPAQYAGDSSDDDAAAQRGAIKRSSFVPSKAPNRKSTNTHLIIENHLETVTTAVFRRTNGTYSRELCEDAARKTNFDPRAAEEWLKKTYKEDGKTRRAQPKITSFLFSAASSSEGSRTSSAASPSRSWSGATISPTTPGSQTPSSPDELQEPTWSSKLSQPSQGRGSPAPGKAVKPRSSQSSQVLKPASPPRKRKLIRGLRNPVQSSPASSQSQPKKIIDLVSDGESQEDKDDVIVVDDVEDGDFPAEPEEISSGSDDELLGERLLKWLNECTIAQLKAIANTSQSNAEFMVDRRQKVKKFRSLEEARRVSRKTGTKKRSDGDIGADIVDSIEQFARSLDGIERLVEACETYAEDLQKITSSWSMDYLGRTRDTGPKLPMPVSTQPKLMKNCTMFPYQLYGLNWMKCLYEKGLGGILADDMGLGKTCQVISLMCSIVESWEGQLPTSRAKGLSTEGNSSEAGRGYDGYDEEDDDEDFDALEADSEAEEDIALPEDDESRPWPNLIIVPVSTLGNWKAEFQRFAPGLNVTVCRGSPKERRQIMAEVIYRPWEHHVVLTSTSQVLNDEDRDNLRRMRPRVAVFDEGHVFKNPETKDYKRLSLVKSKWRLVLTGTPIQNNIMEMVSLLNFVDPNLFGRHFHELEYLFNKKCSLQDVSDGALLFRPQLKIASKILDPLLLRRSKAQVLELPTKARNVVRGDMTSEQKAIYDVYGDVWLDNLQRRKTGSKAPAKEMSKVGRSCDNNNVWIQCRKAASHFLLFRRYFDDAKCKKMAAVLMNHVSNKELGYNKADKLAAELMEYNDFRIHFEWCQQYPCLREFDFPEEWLFGSWKIVELVKKIEEYKKSGDRVLIFSQQTGFLDIVSRCFDLKSISYHFLDGSTEAEVRQEMIDEFNRDESITAFLLSTGAGGTGINLTGANKVIILDPAPNPQNDIQAENRAHRHGQTRPVEVIRLITKGTTEELLWNACCRKVELAKEVTRWGTNEEPGDVFEMIALSTEMDESKAKAMVEDMVVDGDLALSRSS